MPNYVRNVLMVCGRADEVFAFLKSDDSIIDFNKIIPIPKELDIKQSTLGDTGLEFIMNKAKGGRKYLSENDAIENRLKDTNSLEEAVELGRKYLLNIANYGYKTWYDWCREYWGTKWNALEPTYISENTIQFDAAWNGVVKLIEKLSSFFPDVIFKYAYSSENTGCNCGYGIITNSMAFMTYPGNQTREAYELAFKLWPDMRKYYCLIDDNYVYTEVQ